jgi:hypothetical protein
VVGLLTLLAIRPWVPGWDTVPLGLLGTAVPTLAGRYVAARRRIMTDLRECAERTDREQRLLAERARAEERARLAREVHDVVTHRVTLMVLQAGALEVTGVDPDGRRAAQAVRESGMQALDELRGLVRVLRSPDPGPDGPFGASPAVGAPDALPDLQELVGSSTAAGASVRLGRRRSGTSSRCSARAAPTPRSPGRCTSPRRR